MSHLLYWNISRYKYVYLDTYVVFMATVLLKSERIDRAPGCQPISFLHFQNKVFFLFLSAYVTAPSAPRDSAQIKPKISCPGTPLTLSNILTCPASPVSWALVELVKINSWLSCFCWLCNALLQTFWGDSVHFLQLSGEFYQWSS